MERWLTAYNQSMWNLWKVSLLHMLLLDGITQDLCQLGHGDYVSRCSPVQVLQFKTKHVEQIACGMRHSLVLLKGDTEDLIYGFGSGKRGQLGISDDKQKSVSTPQVTLGLDNVKIRIIAANGDHSAAVSCKFPSTPFYNPILMIAAPTFIYSQHPLLGGFSFIPIMNRHLYVWGRAFSGASDVYRPRCVTADLPLIQIALGWNHALVLTGDGEVYMLGRYNYNVPTSTPRANLVKHISEDEAVMQKIIVFDSRKVVQIGTGAEHSALVTDDGSVMTWGWGEHGQLGLGDTNDKTNPHIVSLCNEQSKKPCVGRVYCGSGFTFVVRTYAANSSF